MNTLNPETLARELLHWTSEWLPERSGLRLDSVAAPPGGQSSETWLVRASWSEGEVRHGARWVLRVEQQANRIYQDSSVERQFRILELLGQAGGVPVPKVLRLERDASVIGAPFFLMEHVEGRTETNSYHSSGVLFEATAAARECMWLSTLEALARLHRTDSAPFRFLGYGESCDGVAQELARWDAYEAWARLPVHRVLQRARKWLADNRPTTAGVGLAWGDARLGNVIFRNDACAALLDWETASLGGAETDLGWWIYFDHAITEGCGVPRLEGIGGREATIAAWEGFAGRKVHAIEWHEVFATWRFALIRERAVALGVASGRRSAAELGDNNPAIRRLKQLVG
jgi:aminoglycoside phosphotransferase (APT) family kinase protein